MEKPNEYNYKKLGMKKFIVEYTIRGHELRSKEFAQTEAQAKKIIQNAHPLTTIIFGDIYVCE